MSPRNDPDTYATNLNINLLSGSGWNLDLNNAGGLNGDLNIDLGDGDRSLSFTGNDNSIFGDLSILGGSGGQSVTLDLVQSLDVAGDITIDLGSGADPINTIVNGITANDVTLTGVNSFDSEGPVLLGGDFLIDVSHESVATKFRSDNQFGAQGNFSFLGSNEEDQIFFDSASTVNILGGMLANLGDNVAPTTQYLALSGTGLVAGPVTMLSTNSLGQDTFAADPMTIIGGNIAVNLGNGTNLVLFEHENVADSISYKGGDGLDTVVLNTTGIGQSNFNIVLGGGDDELHLHASTNIADLLRVDFGGGNDEFINNKGAFTWESRLLDFHGFSSFYYPASDFLNIVQVVDLGDVALDNGGPGGVIQLDSNGASYEITPATNLRLNMMPGSSSNVAIDLAASLVGDLILDLKAGDRTVYMVGSVNDVGGNFYVEAGNGIQEIFLAETADLSVAGNTIINLRGGADVVHDGGNKLDIGGSLYLRNVNHYEVTNDLHIAGHMIFATLWETEDSRLDSDSNIQIDGSFFCLGGDGGDVVLLSHTTIAGGAYLNLGLGVTPGSTQLVELSSNTSIGGNFGVRAGTAAGGNHVTLDSTTIVGGNMTVNFTGSTSANTASLRGTCLGDYGTYRGGSSTDQVSFGATATDMYFASLLFEGDDEFTLESTSDVLFKFVDFGSGNDSFEDDHVASFPLTTVSLP